MDAGYSASLSGGTAGPSSAGGSAGSSSGFDASGWSVNVGGMQTIPATSSSMPLPANVGFSMGDFGLPNTWTAPIGAPVAAQHASGGIALNVSTLLVVAVVAFLVMCRKG